MAQAGEGGCRRAVRGRVLGEMLGGIQDPTGGGWRVLVLDAVTTRVVSSALRMSDILDAGVSVVEDLEKRREPLPLAAAYFITPSPSSVAALLSDFEGGRALYPSVHVFFSGPVGGDVVERIRRCKLLLPLLKTLKEVNLEFMVVDGSTFVTEHPHALLRCMGEAAEGARQEGEAELDSIAARLVSALATLREAPLVRYRVGRPPEAGDAPGAEARATLTQRLAQRVQERAAALQRGGVLPGGRETCELVILDRSLDPVAPVIHEWTYEALVYDLLALDGNVIRYQAETGGGPGGGAEVKEHALDESADELWGQLRHAHIADVYTSLSRRFNEFQEKNKAAKYQRGGGAPGGPGGPGGALSAGNIRSLIQALPQFRDVLGKLSVHIFISSELKNAINGRSLTQLGELEQALVYGEVGSSELIKFLQEHGDGLAPVDKMRLIMCYLATHPEKLDATKKAQWARLARLEPQDMDTVCNLAYMGVAVMTRSGQPSKGTLSFSLRGNKSSKKSNPYRKRSEGRTAAEEQYTLGKFDPLLLDVMEDALGGRLSQDEYPCVRAPRSADGASASSAADDFAGDPAARVTSARTNRSGLSWARPGSSSVGAAGGGGGAAGGAAAAAGGSSSMFGSVTSAMAGLGLGGAGAAAGPAAAGRRLVVFVVGGVTRGEMRAVAELSRRSGRDILLGSTSVLRPTAFLSQLRSIGPTP